MSVQSVSVAKDRLRAIILSDRLKCTPDMAERFSSDIYNIISRYVDVNPDVFLVKTDGCGIHIRITGENHEI